MSNNLIIFDCDGVLIDSEYVSSKFLSKVLLNYGYSISIEECIRKFTGVDEKTSVEMMKKESGANIPPNFWSIQEAALMKAYQNELVPLLQPLLELLDTLKIPRCIASNSPLGYLNYCLKLTQQDRFFSDKSIFSAQHVIKPKPFPDLFLYASKEMNIEPEKCIVIEDSSAGAQAAIAAGMQVLLFLGGSHAGFDWYREKLAILGKPMYFTICELSRAIQQTINH